MKVRFEIRDDAVKGLDIRLTPIEGLTLHSALLQFAHELSNHEADRTTAMQMCDAYIEAIEAYKGERVMKIYVVERGEYSDRDILGAFSSREKAVAFIEFHIKGALYQDTYEINEIIIDKPEVTSDNDLFNVYLKDGEWSAKEADYIGWKELGCVRKCTSPAADWSGVFFAKNKDRAIKMAQDVFAKMKAEKNGL